MAYCSFDGLTAFEDKLKRAPRRVDGWIKLAVYDGTAIAYEAVRDAYTSHSQTGDLVESLGISSMMNRDGVWSTSISFDGYDSKGQPNIVKARVLENGRSYNGGTTTKFKIMKKAAASAKAPTRAAIYRKFEEIFSDFNEED